MKLWLILKSCYLKCCHCSSRASCQVLVWAASEELTAGCSDSSLHRGQ